MGRGMQAFFHDFTIRFFFSNGIQSFLDQLLQNMIYWKADKKKFKTHLFLGSGKFYSFLRKNANKYLT